MAITTGSLSLQARTELKQELNEAYLEEEFFWKQKSRIQWLRAEDRNTKYFHAVAHGKRIRNTVTTIQDENGVIRKGHKEVSDVAVEYFEDLYSSSPVNQALYDEVFTGFHSRVSSDMNADLTQVVTMEEIQQAVFDIGPHRAPGHDGFSAVFYHQFWEDLKSEIMQEVAELFERGELDRQLNHTNLCLIPKVYPPTGMSQFRPIALCNVSYKIISKILVNRLKRHLGSIIPENQTAFIPGRMITDNILVAYEIFHSFKARKRQAKSYMAIKTDITKAYDRLEWSFLKEIMGRMGFDEKWIRWIMSSVSIVNYSVLINGSPEGHINPARGIR